MSDVGAEFFMAIIFLSILHLVAAYHPEYSLNYQSVTFGAKESRPMPWIPYNRIIPHYRTGIKRLDLIFAKIAILFFSAATIPLLCFKSVNRPVYIDKHISNRLGNDGDNITSGFFSILHKDVRPVTDSVKL